MPRAQVRVCSEFCAAFRLAMEGASDSENAAAFGVCFSPNFHGHNYLLEVSVSGEVDPRSGLVVDYAVLDALIEREILNEVDHKNLNTDVPWLEGVVPSSENLSMAFWRRLEATLPDSLQLERIRLRESRDHEVVFEGFQGEE
ncbi:MAG: 6-carboxytetrahydropterin synthase [Planctomycetes bacterium]|nr:6-carboxytetrahydropterin synthase [Planctomycetota bacterium]